MEKFQNIFNDFINQQIGNQIQIIDKICEDLSVNGVEIDSRLWFNKYLKRNCPDYSGTEFLYEMLNNFIFYISKEFEKPLYKFFPPKGYSIYKEPYLSLDLEFKYKLNSEFIGEFFLKKESKKEFKNMMKMITLTQKIELMENKLFSYIVHQTNLKFFSKKDIRVLKLKSINEYSKYNK